MNLEQNLSREEIVNACPTMVQVINLTKRIQDLSTHVINTRQKDKSAKRGMFILIGKRNRLLKYASRKVPAASLKLSDLRQLIN